MAKSSELDLSEPDDVLKYLSATPFASSRVEVLSGGNANFTFRLFLQNPSAASGGAETVVLKHAKGWSKTSRTFALEVGRQDIEACALQRVRDILDNANAASLVTVPKVFFRDSQAHVIIMQDAGENSETLKALLRRTGLPSGNLTQLCGDLGRFLATIHNRGSEDAALMEKVNQNEEMRRITAWITYERVLPILRGEGDFKDLLSPSLIGPEGLSENDLARLEELCSRRMAEIHAAKDIFTMGDFWTGNVICRVNRVSGIVEKAFVVDWEVTKPGVPFLDFGQLAAELYTIGCFHSERRKEIEVGLKEYGRAYAEWREQQVDEAFVRGAGSHVGAHLAVITPTVDGWGTKDEVRGVVEEGTLFLLKGIEGDMVWLRNSAVGGLVDGNLC
ncbi:kinase-like domain-containing protein [Mycena amicta]|nr:kinase-like domain-containing protein [Mycena amicta]